MPDEPFRNPLESMEIGYTFDDVILKPKYSEIAPGEADLSMTMRGWNREVKFTIPLISAAMDTVTEKEMCAEMARHGGLGILHKNRSPEERAQHIHWVKRRESGIIWEPVTMMPHQTVAEAVKKMDDKDISGIPITDPANALVGLITRKDVQFADAGQKVLDVMVPMEDIVHLTCQDGWGMAEYIPAARKLMRESRKEKIPIVCHDGTLEGLITQADIRKAENFQNAARDSNGSLIAGVAIGNSPEELAAFDRLVEVGADVIVVDSAHGHSKGIIDAIKFCDEQRRKEGYEIILIGGNVATYEGAKAMFEAGADLAKVGIGPGSICTTRMVTGNGVPQVTAIVNCARAAYEASGQLIADGGMVYSGDAVKALACRAHFLMFGSALGGTDESPGDVILFNGRTYKLYRGMGSEAAMEKKGGAERYQQSCEEGKAVPEGIESRIPYKGPVGKIIYQMAGGIRSGMGMQGTKTIHLLQENPYFYRNTGAGRREAHPHNVEMTKDPPNYTPPK